MAVAPLRPAADAALDLLHRGRLRLLQSRRGARASLDSLLLADFALTHLPLRTRDLLDLACGGGVVGLVLALERVRLRVVGVDVDDEAILLARRNAVLNGVADRVTAVVGDAARPQTLPFAAGAFDCVVSNPPFHDLGGRLSPHTARALAHHELTLDLVGVVAAAAHLLRPRGRIALIHRADRMPAALAALHAARFTPRAIRPVHTIAAEPARRVLLFAERGYRGASHLLPPLVVHGADRKSYTDEARRIVDGAPLPSLR
ncbi:MAG: methyltransferase domain-containing protein [Myxococcales bacterium]|nr:methyltransferase domain-containing protein [Myxococcales bacterium]